MTVSKKWFFIMILFFLLAVAIISGTYFMSLKIEGILPQGMEYTYVKNHETVSFGQMQKIREQMPNIFISGSTGKDSFAVSPIGNKRQHPITLTYTDSQYPLFHNIKMLRGSFLPSEDYVVQKMSAVISADLAVEMFMSLDVIGVEIEIDDATYVITGVYQQDTSFLSMIASNGKEVVYTSHFSASEEQSLTAERIYISSANDDFVLDVKTELTIHSLNEGSLFQYDKINYSDKIMQIRNLTRLQVFLSCLLSLVFLLKWVYQHSSKELSHFLHAKNTPKRLIAKQRWRSILLLFFEVGTLSGVLFMISQINIQIDSLSIRKEQIFNPNYYVSEMIQIFQERNMQEGFSYYYNVFFYSQGILFLLILLSAITTLISLLFIDRVLVRKRSQIL